MTPGSCSAADAVEHEECNVEDCPKDLSKLKCTAPQDLLVVLDGSDSAGDATALDSAKKLVSGLIEHSSFASDGSLLRYSLVLFGSDLPQVISPVIADQQALLNSLTAATFAGGHSEIAPALLTAAQVSQLATVGDRPVKRETVILITGNALHRSDATSTAARQLKDVGTRVIIVQVGDTSKDPIIQGDEAECELVSSPCEDNWLRVGSWNKLADTAELGFFLSSVCPQS
jgi:Mg-chelatase subunit ChlD